VKIDPSGQLLDGFIDLNDLAYSCFSPDQRKRCGTGIDIEDRKRSESVLAMEKRNPRDGG
jgi:hypothetical protein